MSKLESLFNTLKNSGFSPEWDLNAEEDQIIISANGADYEIVKSAAPEYFGVRKEVPFDEPKCYALKAAEVLELLQQ